MLIIGGPIICIKMGCHVNPILWGSLDFHLVIEALLFFIEYKALHVLFWTLKGFQDNVYKRQHSTWMGGYRGLGLYITPINFMFG